MVTGCELPLRPPPSILKEVSYIYFLRCEETEAGGGSPGSLLWISRESPCHSSQDQVRSVPIFSLLRSSSPPSRVPDRNLAPLIPCLPHPPPILSTHRVSFSSSISRAKGWGEERRSLEHTSAEIRAKTATTLNKRQPARRRCRRGSIKFDVISLQETLTLTWFLQMGQNYPTIQTTFKCLIAAAFKCNHLTFPVSFCPWSLFGVARQC